MLPSGSVGDSQTSTDGVFIDGRIITSENLLTAKHFASVLAQAVRD